MTLPQPSPARPTMLCMPAVVPSTRWIRLLLGVRLGDCAGYGPESTCSWYACWCVESYMIDRCREG